MSATSQNIAVRLLSRRPLPPAPGVNWPPDSHPVATVSAESLGLRHGLDNQILKTFC